MSICLLLIWIYWQLPAFNFAFYFSSLEPQQTTTWKGKHATTHPPPWVCGHKIEAWDPRHDENPRNEGQTAMLQTKTRPNNATDGNTPNEDVRNEDATYGNAPNGNATAPNKYPRCGTCIRSSPPTRTNTDMKTPVTPPYRHLNDRAQGVPTQTGMQDYIRAQGHGPCARSCTPPPLRQVWGAMS
ncbi:hypothetical protein BS47DRAFT_1369406 [Hydnum rufescens UP504]|uniref:Uncharacterized protein n=1 Tax=Hydnum rufescens UP504 TaxID=1448309 RepID=A0A9P6AEU5_9AGAM|nr:hypothetical protein BS47DRAFT_1369406 [Hydnum rufescens UP504]